MLADLGTWLISDPLVGSEDQIDPHRTKLDPLQPLPYNLSSYTGDAENVVSPTLCHQLHCESGEPVTLGLQIGEWRVDLSAGCRNDRQTTQTCLFLRYVLADFRLTIDHFGSHDELQVHHFESNISIIFNKVNCVLVEAISVTNVKYRPNSRCRWWTLWVVSGLVLLSCVNALDSISLGFILINYIPCGRLGDDSEAHGFESP